MPILLEEDRSLKLPKMYRVRQQFPNKQLERIEETVKQQIHRQEIKAKVKPGQRVAVAVGSRGIKTMGELVTQDQAGGRLLSHALFTRWQAS